MKEPKKSVCSICGKSVGYKYLGKHESKCVGIGRCRFCHEFISLDFRVVAGHSTYCHLNPTLSATLEKNRIASTGRTHTDETRLRISLSAQNSSHRRLRKNPLTYAGVQMDSSWEVRLAMRLDYLGVKWERPPPVKWVDENGKSRHYFPDFYLSEYDLYLDPKNRYAARVQADKMRQLGELLPNLLVITSLAEIDAWLPPHIE